MALLNDDIQNTSPTYQSFQGTREIANSDDVEVETLLAEFGASENQQNLPEEKEAPKPVELDPGKTFAEHTVESFGVIGSGILATTQNIGNLVIDSADAVENLIAEMGIGDGDFITEESRITALTDPKNIYQPQSLGGSLVRGLVQFMVPMAGLSKLSKGKKIVGAWGKFGRASALGAAVDFAAFDPSEERLSNLINQFPTLRNPVTEFLATNPKDEDAEGVFEGRLKNVLEGVILGVGSELVIGVLTKVLKTYRANRVGQSILKDSQELLAKTNAEDIPIGKDAEITPEQTARVEELKREVKAERPTQVQKTPEPTFKSEASQEFKDFEGKTFKNEASLDKAVKDLTKKFPRKVSEAKRDILSDKEVKELAETLGMTGKDIEALSKGETVNAETLVSMGRVVRESALDVKARSKHINSGKATNADRANYFSALDRHALLVTKASAATSEIGRSLRATQISGKLEGAASLRQINDIITKSGGEEGMDQIARRISEIDDAALSKVARSRNNGEPLADSAFKWWINSILSSPATQIRNFVSNQIVFGAKIPERLISGGSAKFFRDANSVQTAEVFGLVTGGLEGAKEGFSLAWKAFKEGGAAKGNNKIDFPHKLKELDFEGKNLWGAGLEVLKHTFTIPTRTLVAADEFSKAISYRAEIHAQAIRKGVREGSQAGLDDAGVEALIQGFKDNPDELVQIRAEKEAANATFTKPLTEVDLPFGLSAEFLDKTLRSNPITKVVAPFIKTPLGILEYTIDRTPLALTNGLLTDLRAGGVRRDMAIGRVGFGSLVMGTGVLLHHNGTITGGGPQNFKAMKQKRELLGFKPYSIRTSEGKLIPYDRFDPFGQVIAMGADFSEIMGAIGDLEEGDGSELAIQSAAMIAQTLTPEFLVEGIGGLLDAIENDSFGTDAQRFMAKTGSSVLPLSGFLRFLRGIEDPVKRETKGDPKSMIPAFDELKNKILNQIPGLSENLEPVMNMFGEQIPISGIDHSFVSATFTVSKERGGALEKELDRLGMSGPLHNPEPKPGETHLIMNKPPRVIRKVIGGKSTPFRLSPEQYSKLVKMAAGQKELDSSFFGGETLREALTSEVKNGYPSGGGEEITDEVRRLILSEIKSNYLQAAKDQFFQEDLDIIGEFRERVKERDAAFQVKSQ